jgi:hypothetical protein
MINLAPTLNNTIKRQFSSTPFLGGHVCGVRVATRVAMTPRTSAACVESRKEKKIQISGSHNSTPRLKSGDFFWTGEQQNK